MIGYKRTCTCLGCRMVCRGKHWAQVRFAKSHRGTCDSGVVYLPRGIKPPVYMRKGRKILILDGSRPPLWIPG